MATAMRLKRIGAKKAPVYRVVIMDTRAKRDGRSIEEIGLYNPRTEPPTVDLKEDRVRHWLSVGAAPSETVRGLLRKAGYFRVESAGEPAAATADEAVAESTE